MPKSQPGARRVGDRRVISGIVHVLGGILRRNMVHTQPSTIVFNRWSRRQLWLGILQALVATGIVTQSMAVDSTYVKAHRSARGGKGGRRPKPSAHRFMVSILDYGAIGDGVADDTAAIQAAIDASPGRVLVPATSAYYKVTGPLVPKSTTILTGEGRASHIMGSVDGYLIERDTTSTPTSSGLGPFLIERLYFRNTHATGGCIQLSGLMNVSVRDCELNGYIGLRAGINIFTGEVRNCRFFNQAGLPAGSVGILGGGLSMNSCDIVGFETGVQVWGAGGGMQGCRLEVNKTALLMGIKDDGSSWATQAFRVSNCTFEANDTAINLHAGYDVSLASLHILGTSNAPSGMSDYGLRTHFLKACQIGGIIAGGGFDQATIDIVTLPQFSTFDAISTNNAIGGDRWRKPASATWADLAPFMRQCDQPRV